MGFFYAPRYLLIKFIMKNLFNDLSSQEKQRILEMHGIKRDLIKEQVTTGVSVNTCYQITNDADKKIYKVKVTDAHTNYVIGDLTDDKGVVYQGREISLQDNKMSTTFSVDIPATETQIESSKDVRVIGVFQKVNC
jgi:hypothetical protein